jgi:hypothetical protein
LYLGNAVIASLQIPSSSPFISNVIQHYIISVSYGVVTKLQHSKLMKCFGLCSNWSTFTMPLWYSHYKQFNSEW